MTVTICTGAWGPAAGHYFTRFKDGLIPRWPSANFRIYTDGLTDSRSKVLNVHRFSMRDTDGWREFMDAHKREPAANGREVKQTWKESAKQDGYNFRFDAVKFAGQGFIPEAAAKGLPDGEVLVWLDADVVAQREVPAGFIEGLIGDADGAYLGRGDKYSEIGFWAVRLSPATRLLLWQFADLYRTDDLFHLKEWHSAFAWDAARRIVAHDVDLNMRDLTPSGHGHVFTMSPLKSHLTHNKGKRKGF